MNVVAGQITIPDPLPQRISSCPNDSGPALALNSAAVANSPRTRRVPESLRSKRAPEQHVSWSQAENGDLSNSELQILGARLRPSSVFGNVCDIENRTSPDTARRSFPKTVPQMELA
jgi:hypothetical protein